MPDTANVVLKQQRNEIEAEAEFLRERHGKPARLQVSIIFILKLDIDIESR